MAPIVPSSKREDPPPASYRAGPIVRWLMAWAKLTLRRPWLLAITGLLAMLVSLPGAVHLYTDLRTDLRELLPRGAPAAVALTSLEERVGGFAHLAVVVRTEDLKAGERFVDALVERLKPLIPSQVRSIRHRVDAEREYFEAHGVLYADVQDLTDLRDGLRATKKKASPFNLGFDDEPGTPDIDPRLTRVSEKLRDQLPKQDNFLDGYLAGEGGKTLLVLLTPADSAVSLEENQRLMKAVDEEVRALHPESFHASIKIGYEGEVREIIDAQEHLVADLELSSALVLVAVGAVLILFYRSARAIPLLVIPLFVGTIVTFALGRLAIGYLNPNTAFLGSIIIGNGINPGIILLARYLEERRGGARVEVALPEAVVTTWRSTLVASGAATVSYGCLGVTGFRGFNQFAFLGGFGMVIVWISTYLFLPPLLVLFERWRPLAATAGPKPRLIAAPFSRVVGRWTVPFVAVSAVITIFSAVMGARFSRDPIEYDFTKLASRQSAIDGSAYWAKHVDAVMQSYLTPTVVLTQSAEATARVAEALREEKKAQGKTGAIANVMTLDDVLPSGQPAKIALAREILAELSDPVVRALPEADRPFVEEVRRSTQLREVTVADLPDHIGRLFRERDGQVGRLVLVYPTLEATAKEGKLQMAFARSIRAAAERVDPTVQVAGGLVLMADIVEAITHDGFLASLLSFLAVGLLTSLVLRSARKAAWVVGSLAVGTLWLAGALGLWDIKLNFVNFAVVPITFGIGIDYAVNMYGRYREIGPGGAIEALASTGGAVTLCSLTTIIGYSSLLVADNRAIFSFGVTAVLGELTCLVVAVVSLPALLAVRDRGRDVGVGAPTPG